MRQAIARHSASGEPAESLPLCATPGWPCMLVPVPVTVTVGRRERSGAELPVASHSQPTSRRRGETTRPAVRWCAERADPASGDIAASEGLYPPA